jgi:two-component system cell cycle response regulator
MTARVLVVDDILANVKLLEARLSAEYFHVLTAHSGQDALDVLNTEHVDVILLDVMMPGMDGFEVCRRIKQNAATAHLPVIMVTALDQPSDKVQGLRAGADDFLTKPINETALITRVKNLARLKALNDEVCRRALANAEAGLAPPSAAPADLAEGNAHILVVEDDERAVQRMVAALARSHTVEVKADIQVALAHLAGSPCDLAITSLSLQEADGLRFCSQIRTMERLRHLPIIAIADPAEEQRLLRALDMGVNDYLVRPIDRHELLARVRTQLRRKRHYDHLKNSLDASVELAITDPLTGLFNRRYLEANIAKLVQGAAAPGRSLSLLLADIDHFKSINDTHGHLAGDHVLREFAYRLRRLMRASDLVCRLGGEEFIVVMSDTPLDVARQVGERVCAAVAAEPFRGGQPASRLSITVSVGVASLGEVSEGIDEFFNRVDLALYAAKREGRNRVVADAA